LARSTAPSKKCRGGYDGFFGSIILFATKAYQDTAQNLWRCREIPMPA
jgi:hypothetical protein